LATVAVPEFRRVHLNAERSRYTGAQPIDVRGI
jgi:hypothetical protein